MQKGLRGIRIEREDDNIDSTGEMDCKAQEAHFAVGLSASYSLIFRDGCYKSEL